MDAVNELPNQISQCREESFQEIFKVGYGCRQEDSVYTSLTLGSSCNWEDTVCSFRPQKTRSIGSFCLNNTIVLGVRR